MGRHPQEEPGRAGSALNVDQARALTVQIREAIAAVQQAGAVLAERVHRAHEGRIWRPLGYPSWGEYAAAEFGISRAQAYRLVDIAATAGKLVEVATAMAARLPWETPWACPGERCAMSATGWTRSRRRWHASLARSVLPTS